MANMPRGIVTAQPLRLTPFITSLMNSALDYRAALPEDLFAIQIDR
jgi:hypothetical protein